MQPCNSFLNFCMKVCKVVTNSDMRICKPFTNIFLIFTCNFGLHQHNKYDKHQKDTLYSSVMDIIILANRNAFKEVTTTCKALEDLYWEVDNERIL